jgi:hypothetical protein
VLARLPEDHQDFSPVVAAFYASIVQLPLQHGFSPKRWRECTDAVLEKIPGQPKIEKLRIIMLFEATLITCLSWFGVDALFIGPKTKCCSDTLDTDRDPVGNAPTHV